MRSKNLLRSVALFLVGLCALATSALAGVPVPVQPPAMANQAAATPVEFSIGFSFNNGLPYWHGHRGYRYHRNGYRFHDGYWYPQSAFIIARNYRPRIYERRVYRQRVISLPYEHVRWCEDRYRSYRAYNNSFQPNYGGRRACRSPYY
jgi:hypothetical protein